MPDATGLTGLTWRTGALVAAAGGAIGTLARWGLAETWPPQATGDFPWTVLVVNVVGSTLLAALTLLPAARSRPWLTVLLGTGVCGGFTTMSTASVDALLLLEQHRWLPALGYAGGTLAGALGGVLLVQRLARGGGR